jgi:hypothetical protein
MNMNMHLQIYILVNGKHQHLTEVNFCNASNIITDIIMKLLQEQNKRKL